MNERTWENQAAELAAMIFAIDTLHEGDPEAAMEIPSTTWAELVAKAEAIIEAIG